MSRTKEPVSGTCITVTMEGRRPLLAEVQSLLAESPNSQPRRATSGLDSSRVSMLLAVLQQRAGCLLHKDDSYVATVGGVKLSEPATDLAVALAVASAKARKPLPIRLIAFGEVGLAGEVRPVPGINQRIQEAHRLGFTHAVVPASHNGPGPIPAGLLRPGSGAPDGGAEPAYRLGVASLGSSDFRGAPTEFRLIRRAVNVGTAAGLRPSICRISASAAATPIS